MVRGGRGSANDPRSTTLSGLSSGLRARLALCRNVVRKGHGPSAPNLVELHEWRQEKFLGVSDQVFFCLADELLALTNKVASAGPLDCESLDCTTSGGVSTGSVVRGDVTSSGTVSAPQLFASNTLTVTNTSNFADDLFLTKNWAGWSKVQIFNNSAASDSGPELRLLGN